MNFDEWVEELSKGALFLKDGENLKVPERFNSFVSEDLEEEDRENPRPHRGSTRGIESLFIHQMRE